MSTSLLLDDKRRLLSDPCRTSHPPFDADASFDFRQMVEEAEIGICITQDGRLQYVNPKFAEMHGHAARELQGVALTRLVHPDELDRVARVRRLRDAGEHGSAYESRNLRRDGSTMNLRVYGRVIEYRGRPAHLVTMSDISELVRAHRLSDWRAGMLMRNELLCGSGSIEIEPGTRCVMLSTGAQALIGADAATAAIPLGRALRCIPAGQRRVVMNHWRHAEAGKPFEFQHRLRHADGSVRTVLHRGLIEVGDGSATQRSVASLQDITEQAEAHAQIDRLLNYHPITGLATRALLLERAAAAVEVALQEGRSLAMLLVRVPELDRVHGALGLHAGDALAAVIAGRLVQSCRAADTAAHLGGGEFAILLDQGAGTDQSQALNTATRILASLEPSVTVDTTELFAPGLIGIALFPGDAACAGDLLENAHAACGRGDARISFFTRAAGEHALRRMKLEAALRHALARHELSLHYQPQVDLRDGSMVGAEALLRWRSSEFGDVSPAEFVPIAEDIGLIVTIGEWVFRTACEQSVAWARAGLRPVRIGVNLSPRQIEQPDLSQRLQSMLLDTGADPTHLAIEVTESMLMRDQEGARRTLEELSAIGVEIALDDFGTGYSNLSVLRALPFDVLKIDRSLVHDVTAAPEDVSITRAVLMLAQGLKIKVLAEGVETEGQLNLLISSGCELMQGYIFSKPLPAAAMEALLREERRLPESVVTRGPRRRTLLLVDSEDNVASALRRLLRNDGYRIVVARSGAEGLARLAEGEVDVIVSDQRMPGMTGVEFLRRAKALYPDTVRMVLSACTELHSITEAINEGAIYKFLTKPCDDEGLRRHIQEAFRRKEQSDENLRVASDVRSANLELAQTNERQEHLLARQREQLSLEACRALNAQDLLERLPTAVIGIDVDGIVAFANREARTLIGTTLIGCAAEDVLPAEWPEARDWGHARSRSVGLGGRPHALSCAAMNEAGGIARGHLLTITRETDGLEGWTR